MKQIVLWRSISAVALAALLAFGSSAVAQFGMHPADQKLDVHSYPADAQLQARIFANKCSECHALSLSMAGSRSEAAWTAEVKRMQAMASSHINDREADEIVKFLVFNQTHRSTPAAAAGGSGKALFESNGCSGCHSVQGSGNTSSPLDGIGAKRSEEEIRKAITSPPSTSNMPAMAIPEKDLGALVAYLHALK